MKVQRPYVLETVTIDLFIIRRLGVALRRFPQACRSRQPCESKLIQFEVIEI